MNSITENNCSFNTDDYIVYRHTGVCQIVGVETPEYLESTHKKYYKARRISDSMKSVVYIPIDTNSYIRAIISEDEALDYIDFIENASPRPNDTGNTTMLKGYYQNLIESNDMNNYLLMLDEIYIKELEAGHSGKKLGAVDMHYKGIIEPLVCEEFSVALNIQYSAAQQKFMNIAKEHAYQENEQAV